MRITSIAISDAEEEDHRSCSPENDSQAHAHAENRESQEILPCIREQVHLLKTVYAISKYIIYWMLRCMWVTIAS